MASDDPDLPLLLALQGGNEEALNELMERHREPLFRFLYRYVLNEEDARDLLQETFVRVYFKRDQFRPQAKFSTWLYRIALNLCRDRARSRAGRQSRLTESLTIGDEEGDTNQQDFPTPGLNPSQVAEDREGLLALEKQIASLPQDLKAAFILTALDGVGGLTQHLIEPGDTFKYEFTLRQHGTFMYHPHHDEMTQMALGMMGLFIIHPKTPEWAVDRDFAIMLSEWKIIPGTYRPDPNEMTDFNVLTMNARVFPGTEPLVVKTGEKVRIRLGNLGAMEHHPIHLHGYNFRVAETDGGRQKDSAQQLQTTVLVPVGTTRTIEFVADAPGDWALHCHMTHHVMNQMGHNALNLIGVDTDKVDQNVRKSLIPGFMNMGSNGMGDMGDMGMAVPKNSIPMVGGQGQYDPITMGGMFTILKVRDGLTRYDDPGWYQHPAGTLASSATKDDLQRDGIWDSAT